MKYENVKLNYAVNSLLEVGVTQMKTSFGNYIRCYDKEKTICDIIRNTEFDDKIFNALIDRIEVLESTHFVFVLKNSMRIEENIK